MSAGGSSASRLPKPSGLFEGLRHGRFKPDASRVVIECRDAVTVEQLGADHLGNRRISADRGSRRGKALTAARGPTEREVRRAPPIDAGNVQGSEDRWSDDRHRWLARPGSRRRHRSCARRRRNALPPAHAGVAASILALRATEAAAADWQALSPLPQWVVAIDAGPRRAGSRRDQPQRRLREADHARHGARAPEELKALGRYKVVLTRNGDRFIRLRDRIAIARAAGADIFVSLHADTMPSSAVRGLSVYTLSERASDAEAAALAERENKVDLIGGIKLAGETPEVTNILIDLIQRETMNDSAHFASLLVERTERSDAALAENASVRRVRRSEGAGRALGADRARLPVQRHGRATAAQHRASAEAGAGHRARDRRLLRSRRGAQSVVNRPAAARVYRVYAAAFRKSRAVAYTPRWVQRSAASVPEE